jgi:hypothetical protein
MVTRKGREKLVYANLIIDGAVTVYSGAELQRAPGFNLGLFGICPGGGDLLSRGDFLAPTLSLRMARAGLAYKAEFEWLMRVLITPYLLPVIWNIRRVS